MLGITVLAAPHIVSKVFTVQEVPLDIHAQQIHIVMLEELLSMIATLMLVSMGLEIQSHNASQIFIALAGLQADSHVQQILFVASSKPTLMTAGPTQDTMVRGILFNCVLQIATAQHNLLKSLTARRILDTMEVGILFCCVLQTATVSRNRL